MKKFKTENYYTVFHASAIFQVIDGVLMFLKTLIILLNYFLSTLFVKTKKT